MRFDYTLNPEPFNLVIYMLDPRTKLLISICYAVLVVVSDRMVEIAAQWGVLLLYVVTAGQGKAYLRWLRFIFPMALFFGLVTWWSAGETAAVHASLKLLTLTSVFFGFFSTTSPEDLGNALVKAGMPYAVAFVMSTGLQFVPILGRKSRNVLDAQRARGIPLEPGWSAIRRYPAFLTPLLIQSFQLAEELAEAMETRGFGRPGRTFFKEYRLRPLDWMVQVVAIIALVAYLVFKFGGGYDA
jgi:energy-coupling factor transport system permease protein